MFRGRFEHTVDPKGRLALPATFKKTLASAGHETLIITTHLSSPCLVAYSLDEWERFEDRVAKLPQFDPAVMKLRRLYVGSASEVEIDKQGRVLLPQVLREHAKLEREAYWVGAMQTMEIWSKAEWQAVVEPEREKVGPEVLAKLSELGI
ncbi:division/cell wall cluster transcriptional repressor MraZ [Myxococcota bacterium]|nr:division/cell wall cluster transcriptional repressor MraZ [Myxococcota bacterium]